MDTIDGNVLRQAADLLDKAKWPKYVTEVHTVKVELNGQHGGADVLVEGLTRGGTTWLYRWEVH